MDHDSRNSIDRLFRRVMLVIGLGRITIVNDSQPSTQFCQVMLGGDEIRDNTPRIAEFGFSSNPPAGSDAVVVFLGGDRSKGVIIATNNQATRHTGLQPGESVLYDAFGKYVKLKADGTVEVQANGNEVKVLGATVCTIVASEKVRMETPLLEVTGEIIDRCDVNDNNMNSMREIYDSHRHTGVQPGSGTSAIPTELMG